MSDLKELFLNLPSEPGLERSEAEHRLVEALTFTNVEEIVAFLDEVNAIDFLAIPVWLRNLAYRLATLQRPDDSELLFRAAADLETFGPDWDDVAADLRRTADAVKRP